MDIKNNGRYFCILKVDDCKMKIREVIKKGILSPHPIEKNGIDGYSNKNSG